MVRPVERRRRGMEVGVLGAGIWDGVVVVVVMVVVGLENFVMLILWCIVYDVVCVMKMEEKMRNCRVYI